MMYLFNVLTTKPVSMVARFILKVGRFVQTRVVLPYSASMTPDLTTGAWFQITATDGNAYTINAPTGTAQDGEYITLSVKNASGGALGAATFNAIYKMSAWTNPANTFGRTISFRFDGTNLIQQGGASVDIPN